jgi:hypothetical protein
VDEGLLVPGDDLVPVLGRHPEEEQAAHGHALGEVDAAREGVDQHLHLAPGADDRRESPPRRDTGQEQLGIQLPNLVFDGYEQVPGGRHVPVKLLIGPGDCVVGRRCAPQGRLILKK